METATLLQRYRRDREKLLAFLLSSRLTKELRNPSGAAIDISGIDLDALSASYVVNSIKSGGVIDISTATTKKVHESSYPITINYKLRNSFFLLSDPDKSGSPPERAPPAIMVDRSSSDITCSSGQLESSTDENTATSSDECGPQLKETTVTPSELVKEINVSPLGLPTLNTGLSDDDLNESAYEILLSSMAFSGAKILSFNDRKEVMSPIHVGGMKSKKADGLVQSEIFERHFDLLQTIRIQMQISAATDAYMRTRLLDLAARRNWGRTNVPQTSLALLHGAFRSDFLSEKAYMEWKLRQANILQELCFTAGLIASERQICRSSLSKIRSAKDWDFNITSPERGKVLSAVERVVSRLSGLPGRFGLDGENCYWTILYHLNIRLYERLLFGISHLIGEVDDALMLIKLTWSTLGITQKLHNVIHGWVLFQKFVKTQEATFLDNAILELQKVASSENDDDGKEAQYLESLSCSILYNDNEMKLGLVQAVFFLISSWCDFKLQDYHSHFSKIPSYFGKVVRLLSTVGVVTSYSSNVFKLTKLDGLKEIGARKLRTYVESSIEAAYKEAESNINFESQGKVHPLALLAKRLHLIAEKETTVFFPELCHLCPDSGIIAAMLLHNYYGEKLKPFLKEVSNLSDDARSVLPAAYLLDLELTHLFTSASKESRLSSILKKDLDHYPIVEISKHIVLDWMIDQLEQISEWTGRAFKLEDWDPISFQQNLAASIIEVFRIVDETVDQFFDLNLPMDTPHLQALLSIIFHNLDRYVSNLLKQLVEKNYLYPSVPPLTCFKETTGSVGKKKLTENHLDEHVSRKLNDLTISKLCIRLNTLGFIQKQIATLEDGIRKSWAVLGRSTARKRTVEEVRMTSNGGQSICSEEVNELFASTFNNIRDFVTKAISKLCDFTGVRMIFWDLRDKFVSYLYRNSVEAARLENILVHVDTVLNNICEMIDDSLRDLVVLSICRVSLEAFVWVMLNGGPSRAFSDADIALVGEDLGILKDFFVADGEGLPRALVDKEAEYAEEILGLYSLPTETIIQLLKGTSGKISTELDPCSNSGDMQFKDSQALVRVLCHKKDKEASMFLKRKYNLPYSSEYNDMTPL